MHRSRAHLGALAPLAAFALLVIGCALPNLARAAEPDVDQFLGVADELGLECESQPTGWECQQPFFTEERDLALTLDDPGSSFYVWAMQIRWDVDEPTPADPDFYVALQDLVRIALDDDAPGLAWLDEMNSAPKLSGEFTQDGWTFTWAIEGFDPDDGRATDLTFDMFYFDGGMPESTPSPRPSLEAPDNWSPRGVSTYEGTWTVTEYAFDDDRAAQEHGLGDTMPGTLVLDCALEGFCGLEITFGGEPGMAIGLEEVSPGVAQYESRTELDNCTSGQTLTLTVSVEFGPDAATAVDQSVYEPRTCEYDGGTLYSTDITWSFAGSLVDYEPPTDEAIPTEEPPSASQRAEVPTPNGPVDEPVAANASALPFAASVPAPAEISTDPVVLLQSAALAALLVFLMPFPSQLFNSTLETHEAEVKRWLRLDRLGAVAGGVGAFWASWPGVAAFTVLAGLLYGFLDPGFGLDVGSVATFLGMLLGIVFVTVAFAVPAVLAHRRNGDRPSVKVVPVSLLIGVACVLLSRLTDFQPGYLYGLLIGLVFARELTDAEEGRATAIGAVAMLGVALVSWIGLGALPDGEGFGLVVGRTALAALMVAGLEGVVFGLLPMRFLPGEPLYAWNRLLWAGLLGIGAFAFFHILINPASGYLSDTSRTPLFTVVALLIGFSLVSVAFWGWFRFRTAPSEAEA